MKNYIVYTTVEVEAANEAEAEHLVLGLDIVDEEGESLPCYVEIEKVVEA